jgi:hypothetical protein
MASGGNKLRQCWLASPKTGTTNLEIDVASGLDTSGCLVEFTAINGSSVAGVTLVKGAPVLKYNLIYANQDGILADNENFGCFCLSNTIWGNSRDGVRFGASTGSNGLLQGWAIEHNVLGQNSGYDIRSANVDLSGQTEWAQRASLKNAFYSTGSGALFQFPTLPNSLTLGNNPYTNPAAGDFSRGANFGPLAGAATTTLLDGNNAIETLGAIW